MKTRVQWIVLVLATIVFSGCEDRTGQTEELRPKNIAPVATVPPMRPADESPPKPEIERAINRILSKRIEWEITNKNLFADYKISNQYAETGRGYTYFIYEFTAECDVAKDKAFYSGNGRDYWMYQQPDSLRLLLARNPSTKDRSVETQRVTLDGSVTLVKKGVKWYIEETLR